MRSKQFVLDANIWISYLISKKAGILAQAVAAEKISILYCPELISEIKRVLEYNHLKVYGANIKEAVNMIKIIGVEFDLKTPVPKYIPTDSDDDYVIALALQTNSGFVTSGDSDILNEKENLEKKYKKLRIITKSEFENIIKLDRS
ncbi:MAG: putative toxin-antitoxin system toxin component, PIN family [Cyclobacteriaceae bacterium]|nr:putative toxin-antitoxin system toxin component, PIN family [Cyclobacteriaceae bacterium]